MAKRMIRNLHNEVSVYLGEGRRLLPCSLFPLAVILLLLSLSSCSHGGKAIEEVETSTPALIETGELAAVTSKTFVMQRLGMRWYDARISWIADHGQAVHAGDVVIQLDPSEITRYITDREAELEVQRAALEKMIVNQSTAQSAKESAIQSEEATYALSKLSMESVRFESERQQRIRELQFRQATINLERARRNREFNEIINANDLKIQQIRVQLIEKDIQRSYDLLPELSLRTPIDGIFQIDRKMRFMPDLLTIGDQIHQGKTIARVPDLTWMKVITSVHENDFLKIHMGQRVTVRLDALPNVEFPGEISSIGHLCRPKDYSNPRVKIFDVEVKLLVSDERLKPGMTVSCEFLNE